MTSRILLAVAWAALGAVLGIAIRHLSVQMALREELEPGQRPWMVYGPPVLAALLFGVFGWRFGWHPLLLIRTLWLLVLVQVIFFDAEHRLILDRVMFPAMALAVALSPVTPHLGLLNALLTGLAAGFAFLGLSLLGSVLMGGDALGFGDVKLVAFLGLIIGFQDQAIIAALFVGIFLAGITAIVLVVLRLRTMKEAIPYGPFLAAGALVVLYSVR